MRLSIQGTPLGGQQIALNVRHRHVPKAFG